LCAAALLAYSPFLREIDMFFASDNGAGASARIIEAVVAALSAGGAVAYGNDEWTRRAEKRVNEVFEREVAVFFMASGTATNALSISHVTPPWGEVYGHAHGHVMETEANAAEFYSGGAKLIPLPGVGGKLDPAVVEARILRTQPGNPHSAPPATITLTNLTECGCLYRPDEVAAFGALARKHSLALHMDGARFASAIASAGCTPAEMTWKAGVDVLSLGATKCGAIAAEAAVFFDPTRAKDFLYRRMRGGHLLSKMRFVSAQFLAWFENNHWLELAGHANAMARRLGAGLTGAGYRLAWPVEGNEVFVILAKSQAETLRQSGLKFHGGVADFVAPDVTIGSHETIGRLIPSFATPPEEVDALIARLRDLRPSAAAAAAE
jgi:threonine aldolase